MGVPAVAWTLVKDGEPLLCTVTEREALLRENGMTAVYADRFDTIRELSDARFVSERLIGQYHAVGAVCGENFRFGKGAAGDAGTLERLMASEGRTVHILPLLRDETGEPISSTRIRALLRSGKVTLAAKLLGRPFFIEGKVSEGKKVGHILGYPTANQRLPEGLLPPRYGVYASRVTLEDGRSFAACSHFGCRPTVQEQGEPLLESHLPGFSEEIYGSTIRTELLRFIREERHFPSVQALRAQIERDLQAL